MADTQTPIWGDGLKNYIVFTSGETEVTKEVTNLLSWEYDDDATTYDPEYIDTKARPSYTLSKKATIEYEKDAYTNNELDKFLMDNEDETDIAVKIINVRTWEAVSGGGYYAKQAAFNLTPSPLDNNSAGEALKLKGTLSMTDVTWTKGTFADGKFTAAVEG